jgi:MFS family permease
MMYAASMFFLVFLYDGLFILLVKEAGMNEDMYGLLIGAVGAGSVAGAAAAGQWNGWKRRPLAHMTMFGFVSGALIIIVGVCSIGFFQPGIAIWLILGAALGFSGAQSVVPFGYIMQYETTDETIGPATALSNALQTSAMLIAPVLGALLASWWRAGYVFAAAGFGIVGVAAWHRFRTAASHASQHRQWNAEN